MKTRQYLLKNRLCEVLALIQVLAIDKHAHRSEESINDELKSKPLSSISWTQIANEHREFFRVDNDNLHHISLVARHVTERADNGIRELSPEFIKKLIETAIELYGIQKEEANNWKVWLPIIAVFIAGIANILVTIFHHSC